jgi:hypothetical protein
MPVSNELLERDEAAFESKAALHDTRGLAQQTHGHYCCLRLTSNDCVSICTSVLLQQSKAALHDARGLAQQTHSCKGAIKALSRCY